MAAALGLSQRLGLLAVAEGVGQTDQAEALEALPDAETGFLDGVPNLRVEHP